MASGEYHSFGGVVSHDFVRFRVTRHRDDGCTLIELANKIRRRYTVQFMTMSYSEKKGRLSIPLINQPKTAKRNEIIEKHASKEETP